MTWGRIKSSRRFVVRSGALQSCKTGAQILSAERVVLWMASPTPGHRGWSVRGDGPAKRRGVKRALCSSCRGITGRMRKETSPDRKGAGKGKGDVHLFFDKRLNRVGSGGRAVQWRMDSKTCKVGWGGGPGFHFSLLLLTRSCSH